MAKQISMNLTKKQILSQVKIREFKVLFELCGEYITKKRLGYLRKQEIIDIFNLNIMSELLPIDCVQNVRSYLH